MADQSDADTERSATREEIREWDEEHDEPHPVFRVPHRPERVSGDEYWETKPSEGGDDAE